MDTAANTNWTHRMIAALRMERAEVDAIQAAAYSRNDMAMVSSMEVRQEKVAHALTALSRR